MSLLPMGGKLGALDSFVVTLNLFPTLLFFLLHFFSNMY